MAEQLKPMPISSLPKADELETTDQVIAYREDNGKAYRANVGAMGAAVEGNISDAFLTTKAYAEGDYVIYNDTLYRFTADKEMGSWDESVVEQTTVGDELDEMNTKVENASIFRVGDEIDSGADLDDYSEAGEYIALSSTSATLTNCPTTDGFTMLVIYITSEIRCIQIIFVNGSINTSTNYIYVRRLTSTGWTSWARLSMSVV